MKPVRSPSFKKPAWQKKDINAYPHIGELHSVLFVAVTVLIMAYSALFGIYPILILYAVWFSQILRKGRFVLRPSADIFLAALLGGYCILSSAWSGYRSLTLYAAIEFATMIACATIMARTINTKALLKGLIIGSSLVLIVTLINGTYGQDYFTGTWSLVGLFGSKNQVGLFAEVGLLAAFVYLFSRSRLPDKVLFSFFPATLCVVCLYMSRSATSATSFVATLLAIYGVNLLSKTSRRVRVLAFTGAGFFAVMLAVGAFLAGFQESFLHFFSKDTTLTGRTQLWAEGIASGLKAPFLGHGYFAFWVVGQPDAERYWYEFHIFGRSGFHFHNLFIQSFVDLGVVGFLLITTMIIANLMGSFRYVVKHGADMKSIFCLGVSLMFLIRAFVEVDFLGPFSIGALLFYAVLPHLAAEFPAKEKQEKSVPLPRARPTLRSYRRKAYGKI